MRIPPYPVGDIREWAKQIHSYLSDDQPDDKALVSSPVLLAHVSTDVKLKAVTAGVLIYDPVYAAVLISDGQKWVPIDQCSLFNISYNTAYNVNGAALTTGGMKVPLTTLNKNESLWASHSGSDVTLLEGTYTISGEVSVSNASGTTARKAVAYVAKTSDLTTPIGNVISTPIRTSNSDGSMTTVTFSGEITVPSGGESYSLVVKTSDSNLRLGEAHGITGHSNVFATMSIALVGMP